MTYMTKEEADRTMVSNANNDPGAWSYVGAVLLPILGIILGIIALAKNKVGPGLALVLTAIVAWAIWTVLVFAVLAGQAATDLNESLSAEPAITQAEPDNTVAPGETEPAPVEPTEPLTMPEGYADCGDNIAAMIGTTTCPFASNVRDNWEADQGAPMLTVYSPALEEDVQVVCSQPEPGLIDCMSTAGASVLFTSNIDPA